MVKKLFKHEFLAWLRVLPLIYGIELTVAAINRCIQIFESESIYYDIISFFAATIYVVVLLAGMAAPLVFGVTRFYKNLFTGEGYLSFTLPVTTDNHLGVKVVTAVCFSVLSVLVALLSLVIVTAGDVFTEICKAIDYVVKRIPPEAAGHVAFYCVEFLLGLLVASFGSYLMYYTCICGGQLFRKNRVIAAVGVYFVLYVISQIFSTVLSVIFMIMEQTGSLDGIYAFIEKNPFESVHIFLCGVLVINGLMALVYYLLCRVIIRRKLNLE